MCKQFPCIWKAIRLQLNNKAFNFKMTRFLFMCMFWTLTQITRLLNKINQEKRQFQWTGQLSKYDDFIYKFIAPNIDLSMVDTTFYTYYNVINEHMVNWFFALLNFIFFLLFTISKYIIARKSAGLREDDIILQNKIFMIFNQVKE